MHTPNENFDPEQEWRIPIRYIHHQRRLKLKLFIVTD